MSKETQTAVRALLMLALLGALVVGADPALLWTVVWAGMSGVWTFWTIYAAWFLLVSLASTYALIRYLFTNLPEAPASPGK